MVKFEEVQAKIRELKETLRRDGKNIISDYVKGVLADVPEIEAVRIKFWIPGFNDGDPCRFTVGEWEFKLFQGVPYIERDYEYNSEQKKYDDIFYDKVAGYDTWVMEDELNLARHEPLSEKIDQIENKLLKINDVLEDTFGENYSLTITRDGDAELDDYDCGY